MIAKIENSSIAPETSPPSGYCADFQIILPYHGLFSYAVGRKAILVDPNHMLMVRGGEEFEDSHPLQDVGHASLIITPAKWLLDELCGRTAPERHAAFEAGLIGMSTRARLIGHQLLRQCHGEADSLPTAERALAIMREALNGNPRRARPSQRHLDRTKELLHAHPGERLTLEQIARAVGVSPVYLTQLFSETEGMPLYRYQMQLRLNRALVALPHCEDITQLALELGFSSHSHFGSMFKAAFGVSPSQFRSTGPSATVATINAALGPMAKAA